MEQKPELQNYAQHGNDPFLCVLKVGRSDTSLPTEETTEQVTDRKKSNLFISLPAAGVQVGKTSHLGRAVRGGDGHTK